MALLGQILCWVFSVLFLVISAAMFGMGGKIQGILILGIVLILLPPFRKFIYRLIKKSLPWWSWAIAIVALWLGVVLSIALNPQTSIYKSPEYQSKLMAIYEEKLIEWPVPYERVYVETDYGKVHVIVSGPKDAPPILMIHASALAAWSWMYNVGELNKYYRTYCVDSIGDIGYSELIDLKNSVQGQSAIGQLYTDVTNQLGIDKAYVVGASVGGFISTQYALYAPERVEKLALLGSMGYGHTEKTISLMILASSFPFKWIQKKTSEWALGSAPVIQDNLGEWFSLVLDGTMPKPTSPVSFKPEELKEMKIPVLAVFGIKDDVIGDPEKAKTLALNMPDCQVKIVDSGHLIGVDVADEVNEALVEFLAEE